ncbi:hypothetical protein IFM89_030798 [Coptis chinensis]|uniref:SBP-type domain-containing protein n=1 Tax=Coptis chinensis TaxID=261450 RepID=A0A835M7J1_9MAGN|nr:hypothetical protein IFM89_030798 [Coptis chinensis]
MEWNMKTPPPLQWEWENLMIFNGKMSEGDGGGGRIDNGNGSFYSSGNGGCSGSELGNGSLSKSSISASGDSSSKEGGSKISNFTFETVERFGQDLGKKKDLLKMEDSGTSPTAMEASVISGEPVIGLKLGKRTYFEDVCAGSVVKPSSFTPMPASSTSATKRSRASYHSTQTPRCQVEGCNFDLSSSKDYHRRHRVCETHSKCPRVVVAGLERRFCQQCSRFHDLMEFDEKKRSCRRRLSDHNARRRKQQPDGIQFNSDRLSSSFYGFISNISKDNIRCTASIGNTVLLLRVHIQIRNKVSNSSMYGILLSFQKPSDTAALILDMKRILFLWNTRQPMSLMFNRVPLGHTRPVANPTWEATCCIKPEAKESVMRSVKVERINGKLNLSNNNLPSAIPLMHRDSDRLLSFKGSTTEVLSQGLEAPVTASNLNVAPDFRRALSLLSNNPWRSGNPEPTSLDQLMNANHTSMAHPAMHAVPQGWSLGSAEYWQAEQQPVDTQVHSMASQISSGNHFQEFQLFKAPFESGYYSSQMN